MLDADTLRLRSAQRKQRKPAVRESTIEAAHRDAVHADGGLLLKFVSPGRRSVPDRIKLTQVAAEHREIVSRYFRFIEFKRPGEKPTPAQVREHERLRALGFAVDVIDWKP